MSKDSIELAVEWWESINLPKQEEILKRHDFFEDQSKILQEDLLSLWIAETDN